MIMAESFHQLSQLLNPSTTAVRELNSETGWMVAAALLALTLTIVFGWKAAKMLLTFRALALSPVILRMFSQWVTARSYSEDEFLQADGAGEQWLKMRRQALDRLAGLLRSRGAKSIAWANELRESFSDLRFTDANRVPFPFMQVMREKFTLSSVVTASAGPYLRDLDDRQTLDISGSYGLNVAGFDRYKQWIQRGWELVKDLGPVLGPLHPVTAENIALLKSISNLDEVSFHMSGTEAVMAAVRLARFNTRRPLIVCFSGAYHGWWDGVQPGLGSERSLRDCLTLKDMNPSSLKVIRMRAKEIAGVLINPVQAFHPNSPPPSDTVLLTSSIRKTQDSSAEYGNWLRALREVCTSCGIPLIFDEVYSGFRLAPGGAQEFYGIQADMVVYGKTVAGGMPIGLVCGKKALMQRFDPGHPMRIAYVVGTFSAHPLVMGAMNEFLRWVVQPSAGQLYRDAKQLCDEWVRSTNEALAESSLPIRVVNLATVWTVLFKEPGRYNWLLQYYLRAEDLTLSWVGTGRCLASLDYTAEDYQELQEKLISAARKMKSDSWWLSEAQLPQRDRKIRRALIREMAGSLIPAFEPIRSFCSEIMQRKHDDHVASHSNLINQFFHLLSSTVFIVCYVWSYFDLTKAVCLGLASLLLRQFGHAILEPPCHDKEQALLGFNTRDKSLLVAAYILTPLLYLAAVRSTSLENLHSMMPIVAHLWFFLTLAVVLGHVVLLYLKYDFRSSMIWLIKLITDPFTDIAAYYMSVPKMLQL
ncbi:MAG: aminotransferase class III-fold pyridoxal phosphate-dependent enzyme, partial [Deltaproteobacteria bacterium]|nr:aminotransferase class III-fold pyridoxal phosphate-dependent enzyme [Deltaproteobacteria bacterium]